MISVIVPAYNAAATLPACLRALQQQTLALTEYEIIVIDDGSTDNTAELARQANVKVITQTNQGPATARNTGVAATCGDLVLFTDADCEPLPDWIEQMAAPFTQPHVMGVKGIYRTMQTQWLPRFIQAEYADKYRRMMQQERIDFIDTYSAGYRRSVFREHGGFDTKFPNPSVEDVELSFRLAALGCWLALAPRAVVSHQHATALSHYLRRKWLYGYWRVRVYRRYPNKIMGDSHTAPELKYQLAALSWLCVSIPLCIWQPTWWLLPLVSVALLLGTMWPFMARTWSHDQTITLLAPVIIVLRDVALLVGLSMGIGSQLLTRWTAARMSRARST